ncbi:hypothetical protein BBJ28_00024578, partial [Nothophytophthora sp. Chile5]
MSMHNHPVTQEIFDQLNLNKTILRKNLGDSVDLLRQNNVPMRNLSEYLSSELGKPCWVDTMPQDRSLTSPPTGHGVSHQQVRNFCQARYGGPSAERRVLKLIETFMEFPDNECMVMKVDDDVVCGIVMINAAQKAMYARWGECLLFDWTHNTNNLGFYLGELMVTAGSGKGVSVCEMLVADQKKETMRHCLKFFKECMVKDITETFVIDKDFTEWRVLEEEFPHTKVLLCQFHALLAVKKKLATPKMNIKAKHREVLENAWHGLVYASTESDFALERNRMRKKCAKMSASFEVYLEKNWYPCNDMWATYSRGAYFTAGNTTSNRLEATWKQMKSLVNLTCTLDQCISGILLYQNASMRELRADLIRKTQSTHYNPRDPDAIRGLGQVTSPFIFDQIHVEYLKYLHKQRRLSVAKRTKAYVDIVDSSESYHVTYEGPTCGCRHFVTMRLPCYHIMFGLLDVKQQSYLSLDVVQDRWNYADAVKLISVLKETAKTNKNLQDLAWTATQSSATAIPGIATGVPSFRARARIRFTKLKKNEKVDGRLIVRSDVEKYNIAVAVFQPLVDDLVASSSIDFYQKLDVVSVACSDLRRAMRDMKIVDDTEIDSDDMLDPLRSPSSSSSGESGDSGTSTIIADSDVDEASTKESDSQRTIEKVPSSSDSSSSPETRAASVVHAYDVTQGATLHQVAVDDVTEGATSDRIVGDSGASVAEGATLDGVAVDSGAVGPTSDVKAPDDVEVETTQERLSILTLPSTIQTGSKNNVRRQKSTKPVKQTRLALQIDVSSWNEGVTLDDTTEWLRRNTDHAMASQILKRYPRVMTAGRHQREIPKVFGATAAAVKMLSVVFPQKVV